MAAAVVAAAAGTPGVDRAYLECAPTNWSLTQIRDHLLRGADRISAPTATMAGHQCKVMKLRMHRFLMNVCHGQGGSSRLVVQTLATKLAAAPAKSSTLRQITQEDLLGMEGPTWQAGDLSPRFPK